MSKLTRMEFEVCLVGTSMVKHLRPGAIFGKKTFFRAISGSRIRQIHDFLSKGKDLGYFKHCAIFCLTCGSNNIDSESYCVRDDMRSMVSFLSESFSEAKIVLNQLIPRLKARSSSFDENRKVFNTFLHSLNGASGIVPHDAFEEKEELNKLLHDGVHLSADGVRAYSDDIRVAINEF
jgi:hypothetical protein